MQLANVNIAITGATGFLGGYLVTALRARGARVIGVVRDPRKAARVLPAELELRVADLDDRAALTRCFASVDVVISNAALISFLHPKRTMTTNIEGTRNVFDAITRAGVGRAVLISSTEAYPPSLSRTDERTPLRPRRRVSFHNAYGVSKAEAERVAWRAADLGNIGLTTFRPCGITGPHDPLLIATVERVMRWPVTPFPTHTTIGVAHAADVADAVALALEKPELASGKAYNLQGCTATLWQIADAWQRAGGRSPRVRLPIPVPFALRYDDSLARRELGWSPRSLDAILTEAVLARAETHA